MKIGTCPVFASSKKHIFHVTGEIKSTKLRIDLGKIFGSQRFFDFPGGEVMV
jgi:hypothetical protein